MASVSLKGVSKVYDKNVTAVKDFTMEIADKEFIVLVGPSGCGKSTTLRMIAGLEEITEGEIYIDDKLVNHIQPKDRDIAMVFQNYALYPHMTVYENMAFALKLRKVPKKEIKERVHFAAQVLDIEDYLQRRPKQLSGGQRQRVAIGRAIVREPKVFLMDEPLSNLDAKLRNQMRSELIKLHKRLNTTFIYVTHDQTEAMTLGTHIVVMKDGLIQQIGTPRDIFEEPANMFVAEFIGTPQMNFFHNAKLEIKNGKYSVLLFGKEFALPPEKQQKLKEKGMQAGDVIAGIRPEDFIVVPESGEAVSANIDINELMGSEIYLHIKIPEEAGETPAVLRVKSTAVDTRAEKLYFMPDITKLHVFDKENKTNLMF